MSPVPTRIVSKDHGYDALLKRLYDQLRTAVTVGIHDDVGAQVHDSTNPKSPTVGEVALWLEYGTKNAPRRSIVGDWSDENEAKNKALIRTMAAAFLSGRVRSLTEAATLIGEKFKGSMVRRYSAGIPPPNTPSTIKRKGSSTPGIETGKVLRSIDYKVNMK